MTLTRRFQRGGALVTAIFLLVVLSALGVAMVSLSTSQQKSSSLDLLGTHAYLAARSGAEWGVYRALRQDICAGTADTFLVPVGSPSTFSVTVVCTQLTDLGVQRRQVTATACNQSGVCGNTANNSDYVQRVLTVEF